jgi:predicted metal-binding protein
MDLSQKEYLVIVQCDIVKERCPGFLCEKAWHERTGGFADYPADKAYRVVHLTCGGCCGRALHQDRRAVVVLHHPRQLPRNAVSA